MTTLIFLCERRPKRERQVRAKQQGIKAGYRSSQPLKKASHDNALDVVRPVSMIKQCPQAAPFDFWHKKSPGRKPRREDFRILTGGDDPTILNCA